MECITGAVSLVGALVLMGVLQPLLLGVTLVVLACSTALILVVLPRIREASQRAQAGVGDVGSALERAFGAIRTVKASGAEPREEARIAAAAHDAYRHGLTAPAAGSSPSSHASTAHESRQMLNADCAGRGLVQERGGEPLLA